MDRRTLLIGAAVSTALAAARAWPQSGAAPGSPLNALFDQFMKETLDLSPIFVSSLGLDTGDRAHQKSEIDEGSEAAIDRQKALMASQLQRLRAVDRAALSPADKVSYDVVLYGLRTGDAANKAFNYGTGGAGNPYVLCQLAGSYQSLPSFLDNQHGIENKADADAYLARLEGFARLLDQESEVARHDMALGVIPPDFALTKALTQMQELRKPAPEKSSLAESLVRRTRSKHIEGDWGARAAGLVQQKIYPALDRQIAVVSKMLQKATHDAGVWRLPDGEKYYQASLVNWVTSEQAADEIHRIGLDQVAAHAGRIDALMKKLGRNKGTVGERLRAMYVDTKFRYANTDAGKAQLLVDLNARVRSVQAKLPRYFGTLPKAGVEIKRVPKEIEVGAPGGYYQNPSLDGKRPGIYWINLRDTAENPRWTLPTLTYHESIPGHHLQGAIQQEAGLPLIRKVAFYSAYMEGWALYAEQLAVEMGEYRNDPEGHIGQLHDSMFRAVRLVVDTGMHSKRWSREQAIKYLVDTLGDPEASAVTEIERYCVWPGQACSYMVGKLRFIEERERMQKTQGSAFDIRKFHDSVLLPGAVPLELLGHTGA